MSTINTLTLINQLCYWRWNKVLPAVYDDSLSQYEILCKIIYKINEVIAGYDNIASNEDLQNKAIDALAKRLKELEEGGFIEIYESQILAYIEQTLPAIIREHMGIVYPSISSDGHFLLYSATVMGLSWDTIMEKGEDFGRIVIKY